jgi:hypothetical protein
MSKFVISDGEITDLIKKKLLEKNWIERDCNMAIEYNIYKGREKEEGDNENENDSEKSTTSDEIIEVEKINVLFTNNNIKRYYWLSNIELHNHLMNIQVFTDFCQFYLDFKNKYPKASKKYTIKSYTYDITTNNYDFDIMKKDLSENLKNDKKYIVKKNNCKEYCICTTNKFE